MPWDTGAGFANRAWLLLPDGRAIAQDKLCLTPGEQDAASWDLVPGDTLQVVEWEGLKVVILICLDVEMPARSEEHTSELQSLMRISYAVFCLNKKKTRK